MDDVGSGKNAHRHVGQDQSRHAAHQVVDQNLMRRRRRRPTQEASRLLLIKMVQKEGTSHRVVARQRRTLQYVLTKKRTSAPQSSALRGRTRRPSD